MGSEQRAVCPENDALVEYMRKWWTEMAEKRPKTYTDNVERNIQRAFTNVCKHKTPITNLKDFIQVKGVGKWFVSQMREFFNSDSGASEDTDLPNEGKKARNTKSYLPQKNSVAYALLITLYRATANGTEFMRKQELIDAAEASGLSRVPIAPEKGRGKQGQPGSSSKEWYSGWTSMGKLIDKGLVYKTSCPAKYMLSDAGREVALECLSRSGMLDSAQSLANREESSDLDKQDVENLEFVSVDSPKEVIMSSCDLTAKNCMNDDIPMEFLERFTSMGYSREQVLRALAEVSTSSSNQEISTLWPTVLCRLREGEVYDSCSQMQATVRSSGDASTSYRIVEGNVPQVLNDSGILEGGQQSLTNGRNQNNSSCFRFASSETCAASLRTCSSLDYHAEKTNQSHFQAHQDVLRMPPLGLLEKFEDVYRVVLILDDREHFIRSNSRKLIEKICTEFNIQIEVRRLPVGDGIWIARHKQHQTDYVLDFIVERKHVDDLRSSIRDNRYRDQKLRLMRTGIKKIIYVVEGDPNVCEAADSIKTACFTTEISEGFDVQRTSCLGDTLRRYGFLTLAITDYYKLNSCVDECKSVGICPAYAQFIRKCEDLDKMTVSDVFATQLMQVSQVTEEVAVAVLDGYPTLYSLACAYASLDGDTRAQEELLMKESKGAVNAVASRNIFRFVWA